MRNYTYCFTTKMGVTRYATKTTYNDRPKKSNYHAMSPLENNLINQTAKSLTKLLFK